MANEVEAFDNALANMGHRGPAGGSSASPTRSYRDQTFRCLPKAQSGWDAAEAAVTRRWISGRRSRVRNSLTPQGQAIVATSRRPASRRPVSNYNGHARWSQVPDGPARTGYVSGFLLRRRYSQGAEPQPQFRHSATAACERISKQSTSTLTPGRTNAGDVERSGWKANPRHLFYPSGEARVRRGGRATVSSGTATDIVGRT